MPEIVTCPKCDKKARVPDALIGKKVKCPGCGEAYVAKLSASPPAPPPAEDDEDPGFEVVDKPKAAPKPGRTTDKVSTRPSAERRTAPARVEDDEDDRPRRPARRAAEDAEDDEDDRPRRRASRDDDEDDEDDRPRRRAGRDDEDDEDDRPGRGTRRKGVPSADWAKVKQGLTLILISIIAAIGAGILLSGINAALLSSAGPTALIIMAVLSLLVGLATNGLRIFGHVRCLPSPETFAAKSLALWSLILLGTVAGGTVVMELFAVINSFKLASALNGMKAGGPPPMPFGPGGATSLSAIPPAVMTGVVGLVALAGLAGFFIFYFYLRSLALCLRDNRLARQIVAFIITVPSVVVVMAIASCIGIFVLFAGAAGMAAQNAQPGGNPNPGAAFGALATMGAGGLACLAIWGLLLLGLGIWGIVIIAQTRSLVGSRT